jgi:hypothetical protein
VNKTVFLTKVAEAMKGMISHETMMASIQRSCMRSETENLALMSSEEENANRFISGITQISELEVPENVVDVLVLRYLKNTQFLANIKEDDIDISGLVEDLDYWKKTLLYKAR